MNTHRSTQDRVPKKTQLDNFRPSDAIESLHMQGRSDPHVQRTRQELDE